MTIPRPELDRLVGLPLRLRMSIGTARSGESQPSHPHAGISILPQSSTNKLWSGRSHGDSVAYPRCRSRFLPNHGIASLSTVQPDGIKPEERGKRTPTVVAVRADVGQDVYSDGAATVGRVPHGRPEVPAPEPSYRVRRGGSPTRDR